MAMVQALASAAAEAHAEGDVSLGAEGRDADAAMHNVIADRRMSHRLAGTSAPELQGNHARHAQQQDTKPKLSDNVETSHSSANARSGTAGDTATAESDPATEAVAFVALVLQRLITRGQVKAVAHGLLRLLQQGVQQPSGAVWAVSMAAVIAAVLQQMSSHQAVMEKLVVDLLLQLSNESHAAALQWLCMLFPPSLLQQSVMHYVMTEKLLVYRTLPSPALQLLINFLQSSKLSSLLPTAAWHLAQAWADINSIQRVKLPQQAYMTQALVMCLRALPREALDAAGSGASGPLLPVLLQGVSNHLQGPLPAIRNQGMRVGKAFAAKLDPMKPLFEEQGELQLAREEMWPGALDDSELQAFGDEDAKIRNPHPGAATGNGVVMPEGGADISLRDEHQGESKGDGVNKSSELPARPGSALDRMQRVAGELDSDDEEDEVAGGAGNVTSGFPR